ncbi:MAG: hypothetical protein M3394_01425, partial [Actinomycetota bacterium]|nr:hypothetical protein [Actinomycetota bacterium]
MAHVEKRGPGRWRARYRDPEGREKSRTFERKVDAENFLDSVRGELVHGTYIDPDASRQTFESFADEWAAAQDWKATSAESWRYVRARLVPLLGRLPLGSIDLLTLQGAQRKLGTEYARTTVETTMSYAGSIMRAAHASGRVGRDPTRGLKAPKARADEPSGKVGPDQVPTRLEAVTILGAGPRPYRAAVALGFAGLRIGEVLGMADDRIDGREVTVDQQVQRVDGHLVLTTPKAEKVRTIEVPDAVVMELRRHLRDHMRGGTSLLFGGPRSRRATDKPGCAHVDGDVCGLAMRRDQFYVLAWHPSLVGAGLPKDRYNFHGARHFAASSLLAEGAPLAAVAG